MKLNFKTSGIRHSFEFQRYNPSLFVGMIQLVIGVSDKRKDSLL